MNNSIYPVLGAQMKLPFYVSGVGISDLETIGIDTPEDLAAAEEFLKRMKR